MDGIEANVETCERYGEATLAIATALNPYIGYDRATAIVKDAAASGPLAARGGARARSRRGGAGRGARPATGWRLGNRSPESGRLCQWQVLVLQHIACEPPGEFEDVLRERGASIHRVELDEGEPLPEDWRGSTRSSPWAAR